jgi:hypothetical protein
MSEKLFLSLQVNGCYVKWVPHHHSMLHSQFADGGEGLQIWRVAANIWNKQLWRDDKGRSSNWGLGVGLATPRH